MVPSPCASLEEKYTILSTLGKGRSGGVYLAEDKLLQRKVAIRRYTGGTAMLNPDFDSSFCDQARKITSLHHPNILSVYDIGVDEDGAFSISQVIKAKRLTDSLKIRPFTEKKAIKVAHQLLEALITLHDTGLTHGSLSPYSISIRKRSSYSQLHCTLMDVEKQLLAPLVEDKGLPTLPVFHPIEFLEGKRLTAQTDCHQLGHLLYYILLGGHPWIGLTIPECHNKLRNAQLPALSDFRSNISEAFQEWLWKLSSPEPMQRYSSAEAALHDLMQLEAVAVKKERPRWATFSTLQKRTIIALSVTSTALLGLAAFKHSWQTKQLTSSSTNNLPARTSPALPREQNSKLPLKPNPPLAFQSEVLYTVHSPSSHARNHCEVNNETLRDWLVFTEATPTNFARSSTTATASLSAPKAIGNPTFTSHPVGNLAFFDKTGKILRPQLLVDCHIAGDGIEFTLAKPQGTQQQDLVYTLHFSCWHCAASVQLTRETSDNASSTLTFGKAGEFSSHAIRLTIPWDQFINEDSLSLRLTSSLHPETLTSGISLNALTLELREPLKSATLPRGNCDKGLPPFDAPRMFDAKTSDSI